MIRAFCLTCAGLFLVHPVGAAETYEHSDEHDEARPPGDETDEPAASEPDTPSAGGLVAPDGDLETHPKDSEIERELEHADRADSKRGLEFVWLSGDVGPAVLDLAPLSRGAIFPGQSESGAGIAYGGGIGVRILYLTLGARARGASLNTFAVWSVLFELGVRLPLGRLEPFGRTGFGYLGTGTVSADGASTSAGGFAFRLSGGTDYYFSDFFSLGIEVSLDMASVSRRAIDPAELDGGALSPYAEGSSALALGGSSLVNVGFHF